MRYREYQVSETTDGTKHVSVFEDGQTGTTEPYSVHPLNDILLPKTITKDEAVFLESLPLFPFPPKRTTLGRRAENMATDPFRYSGKIYCRPCGRGIVLNDLPGEPQIEDAVTEWFDFPTVSMGHYMEIEVTVRPMKPVANERENTASE